MVAGCILRHSLCQRGVLLQVWLCFQQTPLLVLLCFPIHKYQTRVWFQVAPQFRERPNRTVMVTCCKVNIWQHRREGPKTWLVQKGSRGAIRNCMILLMDKILHHQGWWLSHYLSGFNHPRWCRISSINSIINRSFQIHKHRIDIYIYIHVYINILWLLI